MPYHWARKFTTNVAGRWNGLERSAHRGVGITMLFPAKDKAALSTDPMRHNEREDQMCGKPKDVSLRLPNVGEGGGNFLPGEPFMAGIPRCVSRYSETSA